MTEEYTLRREGALATQLQPVRVAVGEKPRPTLEQATQRPLAFEQPTTNVIAFESYAPAPPRPRAKPAPRKPVSRSRVPEEQGSLDFLPAAADKPRTLGTTVEAVIYCEDPVATVLHRGVAAALDVSMVLIGYGLFLGVFRLWAGEFELNKMAMIMLATMLPVLGITYGLLWAIAGRETPGFQWTHLHLITFDGFPPERKQLMMRFAGSCLSLCTVIGLLWSLADEENLAWQDHMSRTFPTPGLKSEKFLRR